MIEDEHDIEKVKEVLSVISTEIPKLLESISKQVYSTDNAQKMGVTVAQFYKQLVDAGMGPKEAFELTKEFMKNFSLGGMISQVVGGIPRGRDDIDDYVQERIKEKIKKKIDEED